MVEDPGEDADPLLFAQAPALAVLAEVRIPLGTSFILGNGGGPGPTGVGIETTLPITLNLTGADLPEDLPPLEETSLHRPIKIDPAGDAPGL